MKTHFPALSGIEELLQEHTKEVSLTAGSYICMDGNVCPNLPLVVEGRGRVYKSGANGREITLYRIEPGESCILTASCILSDRRFPAFAVADTDVRARVVPAPTVRHWMQTQPAWRAYVFDLVAGRLATVIATLEEVAFQQLDARLARLLLDESTPDGDGTRVLRVTHERLAADLGSAREVVSRLLKDFEHDGLVHLKRGAVRLLDVDGLHGIQRNS